MDSCDDEGASAPSLEASLGVPPADASGTRTEDLPPVDTCVYICGNMPPQLLGRDRIRRAGPTVTFLLAPGEISDRRRFLWGWLKI
jgi:hypothetical protein